MNEPQVIISLSEYNRLKEENQTLQEAFAKSSTVICHSSYYTGGPGGYYKHGYSAINCSEINTNLLADIKNLQDQLYKSNNELFELKYKKNNFWK